MKRTFSLTHFFPLKNSKSKPNLTTLPYNKVRTISMQHLKSQPLRGSDRRISQFKDSLVYLRSSTTRAMQRDPVSKGGRRHDQKPAIHEVISYQSIYNTLMKRQIPLSYEHKTIRDIVDLTNRFSDIISPYLDLTFH